MLAIQMNILMVVLLSSIAIHGYFKLDRKEQIHRLFFVLILLTIVILILEILSVMLNTTAYIDFMNAHKLIDTIGFALSPFVPISAAFYIYKRTNKYRRISKKVLCWLSAPLVVNSILSLGSYYFNWIFMITDENIYVRGPLFFVSPITSYFYYLINLLILYAKRKKLTKEELLILSLLTVIPMVTSIFQLYYFIYLTIWNGIAMAVIINYIFIVHSQIKVDPLTGLGNRVAYDEYLAGLRKKNNLILSVISIDLDDFKSINDVCGHHEGDKVLKLFARKLEEVFEGKGVSIRLGGDEFIVLINERRKEALEKYIQKLMDKIHEYNERMDLSYRVKFSYGMATFSRLYHNVDELIQHSDKLMYEEKRKKNCRDH